MSNSKMLSARRKQKDIFKLRSSNYQVQETNQAMTYHVHFKGPANTAYEKGQWIVNLYLPEQYPYKSPSVGFLNKIYHPNIDFTYIVALCRSGSVCLDVINQTWTPMYELVNIFQIFLPQLLTYPNPSSPLNHQAAELYQRSQEEYSKKVKDYINKFALQKEAQKHQQTLEAIEIQSQSGSCQDGTCSLSNRNSQVGEDDELRLY